MESQLSLERLLAQTTITNCQRKLLNCDPSERGLLLAIISEARMELEDLDERQTLDGQPPVNMDSGQRWFHNP